jgi:hypothetical protein
MPRESQNPVAVASCLLLDEAFEDNRAMVRLCAFVLVVGIFAGCDKPVHYTTTVAVLQVQRFGQEKSLFSGRFEVPPLR